MNSRLIATAAVLTSVATAVVVGLGIGAADNEPAAARLPEPPPRSASTAERLTALRAVVRAVPRRVDGYTLLASAELQRVRETGDASSYSRARQAVGRALQLD